MADDTGGYQGMYCCTVPMDGVRMLNFPDGTKSGVVGLDDILAAVYAEGREANTETAEEIVERLSVRNYIVPSARQKYVGLLFEEYGKYVQSLGKMNPEKGVCEQTNENIQKQGLLSRFLKRRKIQP